MSFKPLLTIVVPTYNRASCLGLLLESICTQLLSGAEQDIEVLIFDNCSTDNTKEVAQAYVSKSSVFKHVRNDKNIGADNNFIKGFLSAQGKYLWMLGDDELLLDGAIPWALNFCKEHDFGCLYLTAIPENIDRISLLLGKPAQMPVRLKEFGAYPFAQAVSYGITFLSASIVNRDRLLEFNSKMNEDIQKYSKSNLVHLTWIFSAILSMPKSYYAMTPIFAGTMANSGGYRPVKVFITNLSEVFSQYFSVFDLRARNFIRQSTLLGWFPKVVFDLRFTGKYKSTDFGVDESEFPIEMRSGVLWWVFSHMVMNGSKAVSFIGAIFLKILSKLLRLKYVSRGKNVIVDLYFDEK